MRATRRTQKGQSTVEYAAVLAFVALLIALAFSVANGTLFDGITGAYQRTVTALDTLNNAALLP